MRVSKEKAAQNRQNILTAAARLFREQGVSATGVDAITKDVNLTHGAVYSQFGSKEAIAAEAIRLALQGSRRLWQRLVERKGVEKAFPAIVATYLSREHRDAPGQGCVVAALGSEIARQPPSVREAFTKELKDALEFLAGVMPEDMPSRQYEDAIAVFAGMVGALTLARAVSDATLVGPDTENHGETASRSLHAPTSRSPFVNQATKHFHSSSPRVRKSSLSPVEKGGSMGKICELDCATFPPCAWQCAAPSPLPISNRQMKNASGRPRMTTSPSKRKKSIKFGNGGP